MYEQNRENITKSFFNLLIQKSYQQITIVDITNEAGISRRTFYRIFKDKDDLLDKYLSSLMQEWIVFAKSKRPKSQKEIAKYLFLFWQRFIPELTILVNSNLGPMILNKYNSDIPKYFTDFHRQLMLNSQYSEGEMLYLARFDIGAIWNVFVYWLNSPKRIPIEDLTQLVEDQF